MFYIDMYLAVAVTVRRELLPCACRDDAANMLSRLFAFWDDDLERNNLALSRGQCQLSCTQCNPRPYLMLRRVDGSIDDAGSLRGRAICRGKTDRSFRCAIVDDAHFIMYRHSLARIDDKIRSGRWIGGIVIDWLERKARLACLARL